MHVYAVFIPQVFYLHFVLGVQDLLRVRLHASSLPHSHRRHCLCHHRLHVLLAQCWRLSMVGVSHPRWSWLPLSHFLRGASVWLPAGLFAFFVFVIRSPSVCKWACHVHDAVYLGDLQSYCTCCGLILGSLLFYDNDCLPIWSAGNGQASWLQLQLLPMSTCTVFTTSFSRQSELKYFSGVVCGLTRCSYTFFFHRAFFVFCFLLCVCVCVCVYVKNVWGFRHSMKSRTKMSVSCRIIHQHCNCVREFGAYHPETKSKPACDILVHMAQGII